MMRKSALLCLFGIGFLVSCNARESIIGGQVAQPDQFPYQVSFHAQKHGQFCAGGIITEQHILTAAHCFIAEDGQFRRVHMVAHIGTNDLGNTAAPVVSAELDRVFIPRQFDETDANTVADIAIVKLSGALSFSHRIKKLKLPPRNLRETYAGKSALIAGWGWHWVTVNGLNVTGGHYDHLLRYAHARVLRNDDCQRAFDLQQISVVHVCAKIEQHDKQIRGSCIGDSGSPLVVDNSTVIGILSRSPTGCTESHRSSIYTRLTRYLTFVEYAINEKKHDHILVYKLR